MIKRDTSVWMRGGNLLVNREELPNVKYVETGIEAEDAWPFTHPDLQRARRHWIINLTGLLPFGHARPHCSVALRQDNVCMCVCVRACVHACVYICMCVYMYVYVCEEFHSIMMYVCVYVCV